MKLPEPLTCSEVGDRAVLGALIEGRLPEDEESRVLKHLKTCPACLSELAVVISLSNFIDPGDDLFLDLPIR